MIYLYILCSKRVWYIFRKCILVLFFCLVFSLSAVMHNYAASALPAKMDRKSLYKHSKHSITLIFIDALVDLIDVVLIPITNFILRNHCATLDKL